MYNVHCVKLRAWSVCSAPPRQATAACSPASQRCECSTVQCSAVQYSTVQYSTVQFSTVWQAGDVSAGGHLVTT